MKAAYDLAALFLCVCGGGVFFLGVGGKVVPSILDFFFWLSVISAIKKVESASVHITISVYWKNAYRQVFS